MIKFRGTDGTDKFTLEDSGDVKFVDKVEQEKFEKAEDTVNKQQDK